MFQIPVKPQILSCRTPALTRGEVKTVMADVGGVFGLLGGSRNKGLGFRVLVCGMTNNEARGLQQDPLDQQ